MAMLYTVRGDKHTGDKIIVASENKYDNAVIRLTNPNRNVLPGNSAASMQGILRQVNQHAEQLRQREADGLIVVKQNGQVLEKKKQ